VAGSKAACLQVLLYRESELENMTNMRSVTVNQ